MGQLRAELDSDHPCLACGSPWRVQLEARPAENRFVVWSRLGIGDCSAGCMTRDPDAYSRGLVERIDRGWPLLASARHELQMPVS